MAFALVANVQKTGGAGGGTTAAIDTTGADLIVIHASRGNANGSALTVSDSKGNTYTSIIGITEPAVGDGMRSELYYCASPIVGAGHTFTTAGTSVYPTVGVQAWSGAHATPLDQSNAAEAGGTTQQPGSITPTQNNELIVTGLHSHSAAGADSIDSGFTISDSAVFGAADHYNGGMAYLVQGAAAAVNPTWSNANSTQKNATIASFKSAAGGGGVVGAGLTNSPLLPRRSLAA